MPELVGVKRNLWMTRAPGGFKRVNLPIDGLILYLPLWHPELNGSPIVSKDLNAQSCTVTNTTWEITGRAFAGADFITVPANTIYNFGTGDFTVVAWCKATDVTPANRAFCSKYTAHTVALGIFFQSELAYVHARSSAGSIKSATNAASDNTWYCIGLTRVSTVVYGFINGAAMTTTGVTGADMNLSSHVTSTVGKADYVNNETYLTGSVGGVWVYNRALSQAEINHIYNTTRWRYA